MHQRLISGFVCVLLCLVACQKAPNSLVHKRALLTSNELQRQAHLDGNAPLLASLIADSMLSIQNGQISIASNSEIEDRFTSYFKNVHYTSWDDVQAPIIELSNDASMATVSVQKLIDAQSIEKDSKWGEHSFTLFAWDALFRQEGGIWKMYSNTSTRKELTEKEALDLPIIHSETYATIPERELVPEGVAYDPKRKTLFASSTYLQKIVAVSEDGTFKDFKSSQEDGLWSTIGMEVNESSDQLWVISSHAHAVLPMKYPEIDTEWQSKVYVYDLANGSLLEILTPPITEDHFFNDLSISKTGSVYLSESLQNKVYKLNPDTKEFSVLPIPDSLFVFPNGIALSDDERFLYISTQNGILQYDLQDQSYRYLKKHSGIIDQGIDGLEYYNGSLIGNQAFRKRILQFSLDEKVGQIKSQRILEANHPAIDQNSTGVIAGNHFLYLANAQMQSAFQDGQIKPLDQLEPIVLLKLPLPTSNIQ